MPPVDFRIGGANRARGSVVDTAVPSGLGSVAAGVGQIEQAFREKQHRDQEHRDRLRAIELQGQATRRLIDGQAALDPTAEDYLDQVEELVRSTRTDTMADTGIRSTRVVQDLEAAITRQAVATLNSAVATRHQKIEEKALSLLGEHADGMAAKIRQDPDGFAAYTTELAAIAEQMGDAIRPDVKQARLREIGDMAILAKVEGLALGGRYEDAQTFLRATEGELTPSVARDATRLIREIQNRHRNDFLAATDVLVADLNIAIIDATSVSELSTLRERVEQAAADGLFESREQSRVSLIRAIEAKRQRLVKDSQDLAIALGKLHSGTGNDDQDEADLAYGAVSSRYPEGLDQASRDALDREFIKKSGWVPTVLKREIENAERVENPEMLARAAQRAQAINDVAPGVKTGAGDRSELTQAYHELGLSWRDSAQLVIDRAPDNATLSARSDQFDEEFRETDWREWLRDTGLAGGGFSPSLQTVGGLTVPRLFAPEAELPAEAVETAQRAMRHFFRLTGDADVAREATIARLNTLYGQTSTGGGLRFQRYPPERYLDIGEAGRDEALKVAVMDSVVRRAVQASGLPAPERYILAPDRETQRRVEAGLLPDYEVRVPSAIGDSFVPVRVETEDGVRVNLRVAVPTRQTALKMPEVQEAMRDAEVRLMAAEERRQFLSAVGFGAGQAAEVIGEAAGEAITAAGFGASQLAEIGAAAVGEAITAVPRATGAAITAVPRAVGEAGMEAVRRHPYRGFLARNRERREQRRRERGQLAETGAAITAVPRAVGEIGMETLRRHPYRGFLARNRERREQRRKEK